jgi:hypothetical protein
MGAIDTSSIERLSVALELAKRIKSKSGEQGAQRWCWCSGGLGRRRIGGR